MPDAPVSMPANTGAVTLAPVVADAGAATAVEEPEVDATAGDEGGDAGDQGDQGDTGDDTQGDTGDESAEGEDDPDAKGDESAPSIKALNDKIAKLKETDPALAKQLKHAVNSDFQYKQSFATPAEAKAAKELLTNLGDKPAETIANLQKAGTELEDLLGAIDAGDEELAKSLFKSSPDGAAKLSGPILRELYANNPQAYQRLTAPLVYNSFLHKNGPVAYMNAAYTAIKAGKNDEAANILNAFGTQVEELEKFINQEQNDPLKPEREKLSKREKEVEQQADTNFNKLIDAQVIPVRDNIITKGLEPYTKGKNVPEDRLAIIKRNILQSLSEHFDADQALQTQYGTIRKTKDLARIVKFTGGKLEAVLPGIVDSVAKHFGLSTNASSSAGIKNRERTVIKGNAKGTSNRPGGPAEGSKDNPILMEPNIKDVDSKRTSTFMRVSQKQAWTKDGRFWSWGNKR